MDCRQVKSVNISNDSSSALNIISTGALASYYSKLPEVFVSGLNRRDAI